MSRIFLALFIIFVSFSIFATATRPGPYGRSYCEAYDRKPKKCFMNCIPVCAYLGQGKYETVLNGCLACQRPNVEFYSSGVCSNDNTNKLTGPIRITNK